MSATEAYVFEAVIIVKPTLTETELDTFQNKYKRLINLYQKRCSTWDLLGKKKLAFSVNGYAEGYYLQVTFCATHEQVAELEMAFRTDDDVLKFMTIRDTETDIDSLVSLEEEESAELKEKVNTKPAEQAVSKTPVNALDIILELDETND